MLSSLNASSSSSACADHAASIGGVATVSSSSVVTSGQPSAVPPAAAAAAANSAKCLERAQSPAASQAKGEAQQRSGSRDNREKHHSSPSTGQIASTSKANLLSAMRQDQLSTPFSTNSSLSLHNQADEHLQGLSRFGEGPISSDSPSSASHPQQPLSKHIPQSQHSSHMHTANTYSAQDDRHTVSDDEERKGEPSAAAGADHLSTPFQQIKALFDKIALDTNKQNRYHGRHAHHHAQQDTSITSKFHLDQGSGTQGPNDSSQDSSAGRQGGAASSDTLFGRANCLVLDALLLPKDQQASVDALVSGAGRLDKRVAVAAVLTAFPSLTAAAPVTVMVQANRLHLHFSTTALMLAASVALPALVRCCLVSTRAWSQQQRGCDGERHEMTEMLVFTCHPPSSVDFPQQAAQQLQHIKQLVQQEMNITVQSDAAIWTVNKTMGVRSANGAAAAPQRLSIHFRVLPRVVGEQEMRALVDRIHGKHKLFGGTVFVHAPNSAACIRCSECDELGHHRQACDQYGGLAVRFLFNTPMPPWELDVMKNKLGANNAYLGNAIGTCTPSRIVTVLFHTGPSVDINTLLARIQREAPTYANQTAQPIRFVNTSQRHKECRECGNDFFFE